ncbi:PqiC family protein [Oleiharenicola lentus]|uniref:PqiC family protein n=1 Tax=Oleiharenicola lentus TaxID=2508720 RepID=UPI003F66476C
MNTDTHGWRKVAAISVQLSALSLILSACNLPQPQADTARHFTLTGPVAATALPDGMVVRPVQLAGHLRSRAMAIRVSENEVIYNEDARWAESLDDAITQLLRARLGTIGGGNVVTVQIQRCELVRAEANAVQLAATYSITPPVGASGEVRRGSFSASPRTWTGGDQGALVGLLREAINEFGDALAVAVVKK